MSHSLQFLLSLRMIELFHHFPLRLVLILSVIFTKGHRITLSSGVEECIVLILSVIFTKDRRITSSSGVEECNGCMFWSL
jgi:hypothetical protein